MSRVRNIVDRFSKAARNGTIDSDGSVNAGSSVTVVTATDDPGLLGLDTSNHTDGSLHYRTSDHATYVYDDSEDKYYPLTVSSSALALPWSIYGQVSGYTAGGSGGTNVIDKFPFAADGNATDVGDLAGYTSSNGGGHSSITHGYVDGGGNSATSTIEKFSLTSDGNSAFTGANLVYPLKSHSGSDTEDYAYVHGHGQLQSSYARIQRFSFSSDTDATDIGSASSHMVYAAGYTSNDYGYAAGGFFDIYPYQPVSTATIDRYPFAASSSSAEVGYLYHPRTFAHGVSDPDNGYGYHCGGSSHPGHGGTPNQIQRFSFSSSSTSTDHSDLAYSTSAGPSSGTQSNASGYIQGGEAIVGSPPATKNVIQKFPFANNSTGTDVGDLTIGRSYASSHQK
jgi:hypothetical protein